MKRKPIILLLILGAAAAGVWYFSAGRKVAHAPVADAIPVKLYFYDPALDMGPGGAQCTPKGLVAVDRTIPPTATPLADTVKLLLKGGDITDAERTAGLTVGFPLPGVSLVSAAIQDGIATLAFDDPQNQTGGGACRAGIAWAEIEATAKQFPGIAEVRFSPETLFQP